VTKVPSQIDLSSDKKKSNLAGEQENWSGFGLNRQAKSMGPLTLNGGARFGQEKLLSETVVLTRLDKAVGWARKYSLFPYPFATACCAMEYMSLSMSPYDIDRFGALLPRFSPRQADLLMVIGTVNHKLSPVLKRVYEQMSEPKWVMAFGACAASGGFYDNYATVQGIDRIIPVDVYVPGCPPRPEAVLDGLMELQKHIASQKHPIG
jgi:NADH-quinone oxidoreductase subunit B